MRTQLTDFSRGRAVRLAAAAAAVLAAIVGATPPSAGASPPSHMVTVFPTCASQSITESLTLSAKSYRPGTTVVMTLSAHNEGTVACNISVGPTSPSFSISNTRGALLWNNCYANDRPGACAMYVALQPLAPGATFTRSEVWNERSGPGRPRAPDGVYRLRVGFEVVGSVSAIFRLVS